MKKLIVFVLAGSVLAASLYAGTFSLKITGGGTYLWGGDFNKATEGFRNYEQTVLGPTETFVDYLDKLGPGVHFGAEFIYALTPRWAVGLEIGYLQASVDSGFERTWHDYKLTLSPTLSAIPVLALIHYSVSIGNKMRIVSSAGAGIFLTNLDYGYAIRDTAYPYSGTWTPDAKTVFGAQAGLGWEMDLSNRLALVIDITGRFAEVTGFKGSWSGIYNGVEKSGTAGVLYAYDYNGTYTLIGIYEGIPADEHFANVREATFSLSGISARAGIKIRI